MPVFQNSTNRPVAPLSKTKRFILFYCILFTSTSIAHDIISPFFGTNPLNSKFPRYVQPFNPRLDVC
jgi:hypothetical protein